MRISSGLLALIVAVGLATPSIAQDGAPAAPSDAAPTLTAFECGRLVQPDLGRFNDTMRFRGERRELIAGCFLIRHPRGVLLWDTGISPEMVAANPDHATTPVPIGDRLAALGMKSDAVTHVGISHYHADHTGGAAAFPDAELLIGKADWDAVQGFDRGDPQRIQLAPWLKDGRVTPVAGDRDVFGDGTVVMLAMPGHTPGHSALLVRLKGAGPVLISGDQYHFRENRAVGGVPTFNTDRADTLASHARFEEIAKVEGARVVIQHEPRDMASLPAFPQALD